jgi:hypothetical protein
LPESEPLSGFCEAPSPIDALLLSVKWRMIVSGGAVMESETAATSISTHVVVMPMPILLRYVIFSDPNLFRLIQAQPG